MEYYIIKNQRGDIFPLAVERRIDARELKRKLNEPMRLATMNVVSVRHVSYAEYSHHATGSQLIL